MDQERLVDIYTLIYTLHQALHFICSSIKKLKVSPIRSQNKQESIPAVPLAGGASAWTLNRVVSSSSLFSWLVHRPNQLMQFLVSRDTLSLSLREFNLCSTCMNIGGLELLDGGEDVEKVMVGPRVGIDYALPQHVNALWRFAIADTPWISAPKNTLKPL